MKESNYFILGVIIVILSYFYFYNKNRAINGHACSGEYSHENEYKNIDPLKHDIFKQITVDITPIILISIMSTNEIFGSKYKILNNVINAVLGYSIFYLIIQPHVINKFPKF